MATKKKTTKTAIVKVPSAQVEPIAQKIWTDIKDRDLQLYALPNQFIYKFVEPVFTDNMDILTVFVKNPMIIPMLEEEFRSQTSKYTVLNSRSYMHMGVDGTAIDFALKGGGNALPSGGTHGTEIWEALEQLDLECWGLPKQYLNRWFKPIFSAVPGHVWMFCQNQILVNILAQKLVDCGLLRYHVVSQKPVIKDKQNGFLIDVQDLKHGS